MIPAPWIPTLPSYPIPPPPNTHICYNSLAERIKQTVSIDATTVDIEEKGVKLRLTVVDTPGFGDAVDNRAWYAVTLTIFIHDTALIITSQLATGNWLCQWEVWPIFAWRVRTEPQEHWGPSCALLSVLHRSLWPWVSLWPGLPPNYASHCNALDWSHWTLSSWSNSIIWWTSSLL